MEIEELKEALEKERKENAELRKTYSGIDDPDFARAALADNRKKEIKALLDEGGLAAVEARIKAETEKPLLGQIKKLTNELGETKTTLADFKGRDALATGTKQLRTFVAEKLPSGNIDAAMDMAEGLLAFAEEGAGYSFSVKGQTFEDWLTATLKKHSWLHGKTTPQGVPGSSNSEPDEPNPFAKETFSIKGQADLFKRDPAKFQQLKAAVQGAK